MTLKPTEIERQKNKNFEGFFQCSPFDMRMDTLKLRRQEIRTKKKKIGKAWFVEKLNKITILTSLCIFDDDVISIGALFFPCKKIFPILFFVFFFFFFSNNFQMENNTLPLEFIL